MNNINFISSIQILFNNAWLLLLLIPAIGLALFPYFRLKKQHRKTRARVVSLVLHSVILFLCVSMLAGMSFKSTKVAIKNDVILLVDASYSNKQSTDKMDTFIKSILDESDSGYSIGIVKFAGGNIFAAKPSKNTDKVWNDYKSEDKNPDTSGTNFESALQFAVKELPDPKSGRIIILSDGRETDGRALTVTKAIANAGTRIDTVFFTPTAYKNEVQINDISVPNVVAVGQQFILPVTLESAGAARIKMTLYDNGQKAAEEIVELSGDKTVKNFTHTFTTPKLHELQVRLEKPEGGALDGATDSIAQNNTYYSYVNISVNNKILILEGNQGEADELSKLLVAEYNVEKRSIEDAPKSSQEIAAYDEVILMNVANSDLPAGFDQILDYYVKELGGSMFTVGGDKAYIESDMNETVYEKMLPVEARTTAKPLSLMLVIDISSSMDTNAVGSKTRLDMAKEGAIESVNALRPEDYVGIITFDQSAKVYQKIAPVTEKDGIIEKIKKLQAGYGTQYYEAIKLVKTEFSTSTVTELKHVIFLSDGKTMDSIDNSLNAIRTMKDITLSSIIFGDEGPDFTKNAEDMAKAGRGRFYEVESAADLPTIMMEETKVATGEYLNDKPFIPVIKMFSSPVMLGISALPEMGGYFGTTAKNGAEVIVSSIDADPIYAEWAHGKGKVGSFMSDLNGKWSAKLLADAQGQKFLTNIVRHLFPDVPLRASDLDARFTNENFTSTMNLIAAIKPGEKITATLTTPLGDTSDLELSKTSSSTFSSKLQLSQPGIYSVHLVKKDSAGRIVSENTVYKAFSYSSEYNAFAVESECFAFLQSIANDGGGKMLFSSEGMFGKKAEVIVNTFNPQLLFLILAVCLFLLDITVRKFKFKWPHEIIRDRKAKTQQA